MQPRPYSRKRSTAADSRNFRNRGSRHMPSKPASATIRNILRSSARGHRGCAAPCPREIDRFSGFASVRLALLLGRARWVAPARREPERLVDNARFGHLAGPVHLALVVDLDPNVLPTSPCGVLTVPSATFCLQIGDQSADVHEADRSCCLRAIGRCTSVARLVALDIELDEPPVSSRCVSLRPARDGH